MNKLEIFIYDYSSKLDMDTLFIIALISIIGPIIGSFLGVMKILNSKVVYHMMSFAAGIMISISFLELIPEAIEMSSAVLGALGVIIGAFIMFLIDKFIPHFHPEAEQTESKKNIFTRLKENLKSRLLKPNSFLKTKSTDMTRTAKYLILGIFIHNFPEGMAIAMVRDPSVSIAIALAIAIHNIPEGICTSAPYYYATGKRLKAFLLSSSTAIPVLLGFLFVRFLFVGLSDSVMGFVAAMTAGLMIYISIDELIPSSSKKICNHHTAFSLILGIVFVILISLVV